MSFPFLAPGVLVDCCFALLFHIQGDEGTNFGGGDWRLAYWDRIGWDRTAGIRPAEGREGKAGVDSWNVLLWNWDGIDGYMMVEYAGARGVGVGAALHSFHQPNVGEELCISIPPYSILHPRSRRLAGFIGVPGV